MWRRGLNTVAEVLVASSRRSEPVRLASYLVGLSHHLAQPWRERATRTVVPSSAWVSVGSLSFCTSSSSSASGITNVVDFLPSGNNDFSQLPRGKQSADCSRKLVAHFQRHFSVALPQWTCFLRRAKATDHWPWLAQRIEGLVEDLADWREKLFRLSCRFQSALSALYGQGG